MDDQTDDRFKQETPSGDRGGCPDSRNGTGRKTFNRWRYGAAGLVLFLAAGLIFWQAHIGAWDFSWDALAGTPAAVINGEEVSRADFRERLMVHRTVLERQYGKGFFAGKEGRVFLAELEAEVLGKMLEDRLVAQEARRLNISVSDGQVRQALEEIGRKVYGNTEKFQASLREEGISPQYLSDHIRNLLLRQAVEKAKVPSDANPGASFGFWLVQARRDARITVHHKIAPSQASPRGNAPCCGSGGNGGGCGGQQGPGGPVDPDVETKASAAALRAYHKAGPAGEDVKTRVTDYGCHIQVDIEQRGKVVKSYAYQAGDVSEILDENPPFSKGG